MDIGLFDSGIGGLTVLKEIVKSSPNNRFVYLADTANLPYGNKSDEQILSYADSKMRWMKKMEVELVSIACNTTDSVIGNDLDRYSGCFQKGIVNIIKPTVVSIVKDPSVKRVGVMATEATVKRGGFNKAFAESSVKVLSVPCPGLVPWIESDDCDYKIGYKLVSEYAKPLIEFGIDSLVYGCTHYKFVQNIIEEFFAKKVKFFDPATFVAEEIKNLRLETSKQSFEFYVTDLSAKNRLEKTVYKLFKIEPKVELVSL